MMTMSEFDVSAVDLSGLLNKEPEEKARQVPDPATYHILCMLPKAEEEFSETGILKSATAMLHEELLSLSCLWPRLAQTLLKTKSDFLQELPAKLEISSLRDLILGRE
jgi:hypothetical protein